MWNSNRLWNLYDALIVLLAWADEIYILAMSSDLAISGFIFWEGTSLAHFAPKIC